MIEGYSKYNAERLRLKEQDAGDALLSSGKKDLANEGTQVSPQAYYYGMQIQFSTVRSMNLRFDTFIPEVYLSFTDYTRVMADAGFPTDDAYITIFVPSRNPNVRPIFMNFKIVHFDFSDETGEAQMHIWGLCDVSQLFVNQHKSYNAKTSWDVVKSLAEDSGLGFASNVGSTSDVMTWINPGDDVMTFAKDVTAHAWNGEGSFMFSYIDPYYNLCFIDMEKALQSEGAEGLVTTSSERIAQQAEDKQAKIVLSNDKSFQASNTYFNKYRIVNQSTGISLKNGYRRDVYYYDRTGNWDKKAGTFLTMTVDSISTPGSENTSVILKGQPQDEKFYNDNVGLHYAGKYDRDNMHRDYHYATVQNQQNLGDIQKVYVTIILPVPNYTITKFSKVQLVFSAQGGNVGASAANKRLSGKWLVTGIVYRYTGKGFEQQLTLVKRELNVTDISK